MSGETTGGATAAGTPSSIVLPPVVQIYPDREALADAAAERVAHLLAATIEERGAASLALAGGSTPRPVYERLAEAAGRDGSAGVDWSRVDVYWGDERAVPADDPASNYLMARRALLDRVPVNPGHVHRIQGERPAEEAARLYEVELILTLGKRQRTVPEGDEERRHGDDDPEYRKLKEGRAELRDKGKSRGLDSLRLDRVRLDLNLLGLGDDGHTASLFPATFAGHEAEPGYDPHPRRLAAATRAPDPPHDRITLSLATLSAARRTVFLVSGEEKAEAVARVMEARGELDALLAADAEGRDAGGRKVSPVSGPIPPAARVRPTKAPALWLLDLAAASRLPAPEA